MHGFGTYLSQRHIRVLRSEDTGQRHASLCNQRADRSVLGLRRKIVVKKTLTRVFKRLCEGKLCVYTCSSVWVERCEKEVR